MTRVAILWHMHQPYYQDLVTREHILPWVRLHALKDYYGMVALLEEFPDVRVTFNLVPSLLIQLEAFAADEARDRALELSLKPADTLTDDDVVFVLQNFFHAQRQRMIDPFPRYAELLTKRGASSAEADIRRAAPRFTVDELRDLQIWHKLVWLDPYYFERDGRVQELASKGRHYTEDDKRLLRAIELELLNAVIPAYRRRAEAGQIEISTSPFYHPILPLLCDTEIYKRTHPDSRMPRHRFTRPEDALEQLTRAADCHERLFGRRPTGLWPSEGSVSDAMVPLVQRAGFKWMATDEQILGNSLGAHFSRDGAGRLNHPDRLYAPYIVQANDAQVACGFRDHALSDLIGFVYSGWAADAAADDFVGKLAEAGRHGAPRSDGEEPTIFVILDGENAWEHFEAGGRPFLRALYGRLSNHPELRTVTMGEACEAPSRMLSGIFPGSWIDSNFYIWIGHPDDHRAWSQLAEARMLLDDPGPASPDAIAAAREEIYVAEGSDWCWWYGDDHSSDHDAEFDDLFRRHLRNVYRLLDKPVPEELFVTNISAGAGTVAQEDPIGLMHATIDGEETSYFEWLGAGRLQVRDSAGAMHQAERRSSLLTTVLFGFGRERLYVRLDAVQPMARLLADGFIVALTFLEPIGLRFVVRSGPGGSVGWRWERLNGAGHQPPDNDATEIRIAAGPVLEVALPLQALGAPAGSPLGFFVTVRDPGNTEVERHPGSRPIELNVPDAGFESKNWTA